VVVSLIFFFSINFNPPFADCCCCICKCMLFEGPAAAINPFSFCCREVDFFLPFACSGVLLRWCIELERLPKLSGMRGCAGSYCDLL